MTEYLPPNLLALFAPREPIPFLPPPDKLPHEKKNRGYSGVGDFLGLFEDPADTPLPKKVETREERLERRRREKEEQVAYKLEQEIALWDPQNLPTATSDPFKTLFVARINYDTSESKLRREFEVYGPIKKIMMTHNVSDGKPRGYAFIEYEHERDMHTAYKHADGKKIDGRRVLVDVERARTVKGWLPRRLGGGLGGTRRGGPENATATWPAVEEAAVLEAETTGNAEAEAAPTAANGAAHAAGSGGGSRSRSRERKRHRSRSRDRRGGGAGGGGAGGDDFEENGRSAGRDRKRARRSRSRDRSERKKDKKRDRERGDRESRKERRGDKYAEPDEPRIKEEPLDDYPDYLDPTPDFSEVDNYGAAAVKYERMLAMSEAAAQHRTYLRLTEQEFDSLPLDILSQGILSLFVTMYGLLHVVGEFKEIRATVELEEKTWDLVGNNPSFYSFNHRGKTLQPNYQNEKPPSRSPLDLNSPN
ncbi:Hypothetical predicted protein [Cloeon dipterum]|uniref:U1 small nuclear ribonucleoprotein 70 kDa n=1 Tax=Cloeon dipterum TaxID=197152 RepID=A0A8S1CI18_9INSE|nr:Hypothetical predicted protein [Cloeon dipterum]